MWRLMFVVLVAAGCVGGWYVHTNYDIQILRTPEGQFQRVSITAKAAPTPTPSENSSNLPPAAPLRPAIRIAAFNLDGLDEAKLANPVVSDAMVRVIPRFDVIAVQNVHAKNRSVLVRLIEQINATGRCYNFAVCPSLDRSPPEQYNAMLFDRTTVEVDLSTVRSVEDPAGRFRTKPLVGLFRVRGPPPNEAFTFTLVNVLIDPARATEERDLLADVFRAVRDGGQNEDDVIMLGSLEADPEHLGRIARVPDIMTVINGIPTTTRGTQLVDNILFNRRMTVEFTGRSSVLDLIRELDLKPEVALEVSEHLPVWAEFSSFEGGQSGHIAVGLQ